MRGQGSYDACVPTLSEPAPEIFPGIVDATPDAVVVVDATGVLRFANTCAEALFGGMRHELVGQPLDTFVPGLADALATVLDGSGAGRPVEVLVQAATGVPVAVWLTPLAGEPEGLVAVTIRDDTERRSLREESARMRDALFASVSHELRTPLTSILGYTEILVDMGAGALSEQAVELLGVIERNAERELRLVEDLLTLAALGSTGLAVTPAPTDLTPVVSEVLHSFSPQATEGGVLLRHSCPAEMWVAGDARQLRQVVANLVGNAIKFTPVGGQVAIEAWSEEDHGVLAVEDQGIGVRAEELPLLFEGLYRGAHAVSSHLPGAGLGLPIVKGIVDAHGGEIDVESEDGRGTRVLVRIPLALEGDRAPQKSRCSESSTPRSAS